MKENCWDNKKCGRQPGGEKAAELGVCPAALEQKLDGIHDGKNSGRSCWVITGTLCDKKVQGDFNTKFANCLKCEFYKLVKDQESGSFIHSNRLLKQLRTGEKA